MAQISLNTGTFANDGTGTNRRTAFQAIESNFDELYIRGMIQSQSFVSPSTSTISNSDSAVYVDTDLTVSITTRSASSKLRVNFQGSFGSASVTQTGVKGNIQKKVDAGGWTDVLYGNQKYNFVNKYPAGETSKKATSSITQIDSPGLGSVVQFKVTFAPFLNGEVMEYRDDESMNMITVDEILET